MQEAWPQAQLAACADLCRSEGTGGAFTGKPVQAFGYFSLT